MKHLGSSAKIILAFSIVVFSVVLVSTLMISAISAFLFRMGLLDRPHPMMVLLMFGVISIVISTILAGVVGKRTLAPIIQLTEATKEIAKGNYTVRMEDSNRFQEMREMAQNFNLMARQLENTETLRSDFIANVSHEFKTPMSVIEGYATLLQNKELSEVEREEYVNRILKGTRRLSSLSSNILQLSNLENQDIQPLRESFALDEQLRQIVLFYEPEWSKKELNLDIDLEQVTIRGAKTLLAQVWQNIFENAVKFAPVEGTVRVILREKDGEASVSISDNGFGMADKVKERIFEKFYQGDKSRSTEGNGLGLALVKRIVEIDQGRIEVSSTLGRGSTFTVTLPMS